MKNIAHLFFLFSLLAMIPSPGYSQDERPVTPVKTEVLVKTITGLQEVLNLIDKIKTEDRTVKNEEILIVPKWENVIVSYEAGKPAFRQPRDLGKYILGTASTLKNLQKNGYGLVFLTERGGGMKLNHKLKHKGWVGKDGTAIVKGEDYYNELGERIKDYFSQFPVSPIEEGDCVETAHQDYADKMKIKYKGYRTGFSKVRRGNIYFAGGDSPKGDGQKELMSPLGLALRQIVKEENHRKGVPYKYLIFIDEKVSALLAVEEAFDGRSPDITGGVLKVYNVHFPPPRFPLHLHPHSYQKNPFDRKGWIGPNVTARKKLGK